MDPNCCNDSIKSIFSKSKIQKIQINTGNTNTLLNLNMSLHVKGRSVVIFLWQKKKQNKIAMGLNAEIVLFP